MTKKIVAIVFSIVLILTTLSIVYISNNKVLVDGKISWQSDKPLIYQQKPYISLATLANLYEATLEYDKQSKTYYFYYLNKVFSFDTAQSLVKQNNETTTYSMLVNHNKPYVSQAFVEDFFNVKVSMLNKKRVELKSNHIIPILMYHTVNERANDAINTQPDRFDEHIKAIQDAGYTAISAEQLYRYYYEQVDLPANPIMITFDDGYKDNYTNAYPILKKHNTKATIFTITSRIEHEGINSYPNEIPKLTWEDIDAMRDLVMVQSHSWDSHRKIPYKRDKQKGQLVTKQTNKDGIVETTEEYVARVENDLQLAQSMIKEKTGYDSYILSYPYGETNAIVKEVAKNVGVKLAVSVLSDVNYSHSNLFNIRRLTVDGNYSGEELVNRIEKATNKH